MIEVRIISATKHDGLILKLVELPRANDTFELDARPYRVHKVLHRVTSTVVAVDDGSCLHEIGLVLESL